MLGYANIREPRSSIDSHMGRSEAPLRRDQREEIPGRANRKTLLVVLSRKLPGPWWDQPGGRGYKAAGR